MLNDALESEQRVIKGEFLNLAIHHSIQLPVLRKQLAYPNQQET